MTLVFNPAAFKHNITGQDVEAAMKCRKELLRTLWERGYYADFN
jgi:hypothetical protein